MKDVDFRKVYTAKVSGNLVPVSIREPGHNKYRRRQRITATNLMTGREVSFTAAKLRREVGARELWELSREVGDPRKASRLIDAAARLDDLATREKGEP